MSGVERIQLRRSLGERRLYLGDYSVAILVILAEAAVIVACAVLSGVGYHLAVYGYPGGLRSFASVGLLTALLYALPFVAQGEHSAAAFLTGRRTSERIVMRWIAAFVLLAAVGFLTKSTATFSRGWVIIYFAVGLVALLRLEAVAAALIRTAAREGRLATQRLMLVGRDEDIERFWSRREPSSGSHRVVSVMRLSPDLLDVSDRGRLRLEEALSTACDDARRLAVDAVLLLPGASAPEVRAQCQAAFSLLPVSVHLDTGAAIDGIASPRIERVGSIAALTLTTRPLRPLGVIAKRTFDLAGAAIGLAVLAIPFAVIAALIKLDSKGPVFFRQHRRGFNHQEFRIFKFRTMTTLDDGAVVVQARKDDPRVTRVGRWLRRWSIDELPQLINVLRGEMSLVGPRPHAVAHDVEFGARIHRYDRRLNVKPGMTGWAQIHGLRGETDTDDKMSARVEHDLYYIDNWSLALDLYIVVMTVCSPRAFRNAH